MALRLASLCTCLEPRHGLGGAQDQGTESASLRVYNPTCDGRNTTPQSSARALRDRPPVTERSDCYCPMVLRFAKHLRVDYRGSTLAS